MGYVPKSALLKTSTTNDVKVSGGVVSITGLQSFRLKDILSASQIKNKSEVVQVVTVGGSSYTPTGDTVYAVKLISDAYSVQGNSQHVEKVYKYKTPVDITTLGATEALQREAIHAALVTRINNISNNNVVAASLGTGTGFTITDDAGYFPARVNGTSNGRAGATTVLALQNTDGTGFTYSDGYDVTTDLSITTAAVYGFGQGERMNDDNPIYHNYTGNLISGEIGAPVASDGTYAVDDQNYDAFTFRTLVESSIPTIGNSIQGYRSIEQYVFVDDGTGSATTNLAGFEAFERKAQKVIFSLYADDHKTVQEWFDKPIVFQDPLGAAPTGTANTLGWQMSPYGALNRTNIGTQTIVTPVLSGTGLLLDQDDNAGDGSHTSANQQTLGSQSFVVGQEEFSVVARVIATDWTDSHLLVGFRKKATYTADFNDYTDLAAIGSGAADGDSVTTHGILNNAATVSTDALVNFTDSVSAELMIKVAIDGTVTAFFNGVSYPIYSVGTTALVLDADDEFIPFYQHVNIGSGNPAITISSFVAVPSATWKLT